MHYPLCYGEVGAYCILYRAELVCRQLQCVIGEDECPFQRCCQRCFARLIGSQGKIAESAPKVGAHRLVANLKTLFPPFRKVS